MKPPEELNKMADLVLSYHPKPKMKAGRKRAKKTAKKGKGDGVYQSLGRKMCYLPKEGNQRSDRPLEWVSR
jgi:hypothetical protein